MPRRITLTIATLACLGCASAAPGNLPPIERTTPEARSEPEVVQAPTEEPAPGDERTEPTDPAALSVRLTLDHPVMPAMTSPSASVEARLDMTLHVRGPAGATVTMVVPMAFELEWSLTASDGTVWQPVFYPPPMPRPGGPPTTTVTIPASGEIAVGAVHGISGFRRPGDTSFQDGLPAGRYEVVVRRIDVGGVRRDAPPMTLIVR